MKNELDLFQKITESLLQQESEEPVIKPIPANQLFETLDISLGDEPTSEEEFANALEGLVLKTPRTATRRFFNQLFGGRNSKATLGDLLAVVLNNSMYTYKVAGPQVGIEKEILKQVCKTIGYSDQADGTFAPGGSMCNFVAALMARDAKDENIKHKGISGKYIIYTSAESHYSTAKNAAMIGIGRDQVRNIKSDDFGTMETSDLQHQIQKDLANGNIPFFVNATAGTTVLGAFDDIESISKVCKRYDLWLHVDGAYCGSVIFSKKYRHLVKGLHLSDSFCFNAHKMLGTPLSCSILVTQNKKHLNDSLSNDATYLYQTDGDDYNLGKTSIQCGRRNDALKFWTLWKSVGTTGLANLVDKQFYLADVAREYIAKNPDYTLYSFENSVSICFNYKNIDPQLLCTKLYESGELMVGYGTFRDTSFIRLVTINAGNNQDEIIQFFEILEAYVAKHPEVFSAEIYQ